jgi:hypothetical protein
MTSPAEKASDEDKDEMNPWLREKLKKADILSIIEPYFNSKFTQVSCSTS